MKKTIIFNDSKFFLQLKKGIFSKEEIYPIGEKLGILIALRISDLRFKIITMGNLDDVILSKNKLEFENIEGIEFFIVSDNGLSLENINKMYNDNDYIPEDLQMFLQKQYFKNN